MGRVRGNAIKGLRWILNNSIGDGIEYHGRDVKDVFVDALIELEGKALGIDEWVPINSEADLPKDRKLWVTVKYCGAYRVEELCWDMTEWSDNFVAKYAIAYMDFYEPEPYKEVSDDKSRD